MACRLASAKPLSEPVLEIRILETNFCEILIKNLYFHSPKCIGKWQPFCRGVNVLISVTYNSMLLGLPFLQTVWRNGRPIESQPASAGILCNQQMLWACLFTDSHITLISCDNLNWLVSTMEWNTWDFISDDCICSAILIWPQRWFEFILCL